MSLRRRAVLVGAVASTLAPALADATGPSVTKLLADVEAASADLLVGSLDGPGWKRAVERALAGVDARALLGALTLDWRDVSSTTRQQGRWERRLEAGELAGLARESPARAKLFSLRRKHAIVPHAHRHVVSVFVLLDGRARGRHYDRVRDEPDAIVIRATDDRSFAPGDHAAICDQSDNVHWFCALDDALLLNFSATVPPRFRVDGGSAGRIYLDPDGEALADGSIRAPRVGFGALTRKYDGTGL